MAHGKHVGTGLYVVVALILAVITFIEYAIVEFPPTWMSSSAILFSVIVMSVVKFWMVIWFFMHLRDDPKIYTGFLTSGMVITLATFAAVMAMFVLPRAVAPVMAQEVPAEQVAEAPTEPDPLGAEQRELIDSDGASRPLSRRAAAPRPRDGSLMVTPPAAAEGGFTVRLDAPEPAEPLADVEPADEPIADDEVPLDEPDAVAAEAPADPSFDTELGASTYASCMGCHQANGQGVPGAFPPLAGHAAELFNAEGGRSYLVNVMLYGLQGEIVVGGTTYNGLMPAFGHLADDAIAAVLNHTLVEWGNDELIDDFDAIRAEEIANERDQGLSPGDVLELRQGLVFAAPEPEAEAEPEAEPEPEPEPEPEVAETEPAEPTEPAVAEAPADPSFDTELGASTYSNCIGCHQPTGQGIPGAFPPLAGHTADLFNAEGGRSYLIDMMLYGVQGQIVVDGATYNGVMPGWQQLSDDAIAAVLNHTLVEWGNDALIDDFDAIRADEIAAQRGRGLSVADVYQLRGELGLE